MNRTATTESPRRTLDWATLLPAACAVHCTLTPLVAATLPILTLSHELEWFFMGTAGVLAVAALRVSWSTHRRRSVLVLAALGWMLWLAALAGVVGPEPVLAPIGGLVLAAALWLNGRFRHEAACRDCGCGMHG